MENLYSDGKSYLRTTVLPKYNCSNCSHMITHSIEVVQPRSIKGYYAIECVNLVHPLADCILRGFEGHSDQPSLQQTLNK